VGITGSNGKTTTKEMTALILEGMGKTLKNQGNLNNLIGLPLTLLKLERDHRTAVLEMGMNRPGEIGRLTEIADPDVGVITNLAKAHLDGVGDLQGVARAKVEMIRQMSPQAKAVLNGDDPLLLETAFAFRTDVVTFGIGDENTIRATHVENHGRDGVRFLLRFKGGGRPVHLKVPGLQNVINAPAAASACLCLGVPLPEVIEGLGLFGGIPGRFQVTLLPGERVLVDDTYNANPESIRAAAESLEGLVSRGGRILVGLGEMMELGKETVTAHREMGKTIAGLSPHLFLAMGPHASEMVEGARKAGMQEQQAEVVDSHDQMFHRLVREVRERDLIFLKGSRKMELDRVVQALRKTFVPAGASSRQSH
jgi:UDP-N-acetylmuramoyl-tripeptide--D-alanyl-D-alanine ligase